METLLLQKFRVTFRMNMILAVHSCLMSSVWLKLAVNC